MRAYKHNAGTNDTEWVPQIFDIEREEDLRQFSVLREDPRTRVVDTIESQLMEWARCKNPRAEEHGKTLSKAALASRWKEEARSVLAESQRSALSYGRWIYFPWNSCLVHLLPPDAFREVRFNRNRYRITPQEQARLASASIGVVGLSVGHSVVLSLVLEGVGGHYRLADMDTLEVSNLNRIPASIHALGTKKTTYMAQRIYELNPYLHVELYEEGLREEDLEGFFCSEPQLSLLIEECDDFAIKVRSREVAKSRQVPVLMATSDRDMLDVERFDRYPQRPSFHGLAGEIDPATLGELTKEQEVGLALRIIGTQTMSKKMGMSLAEIEQTLDTWPQLASSVLAGGAHTTIAARRILLGQPMDSGRYFLDSEGNLSGETPPKSGDPLAQSGVLPAECATGDLSGRATAAIAGDQLTELQKLGARHGVPSAGEEWPIRSIAPPAAPPLSRGEKPSEDEVRYLLAHGVRAPSGGNIQPWFFRWDRGSGLHCGLDRERVRTLLDFESRASELALGAAVESMALLAQSRGWRTKLVDVPRPGANTATAAVSERLEERTLLRFYRGTTDPYTEASAAEDGSALGAFAGNATSPLPSVPDDGISALLFARATTRRLGKPEALVETHKELLCDSARSLQASLHLFEGSDDIRAIGEFVGRMDRFRFTTPALHRELMGEVRWSADEALSRKDGIDLPSLELSDADEQVMHLLRRPEVLQDLGHEPLGSGLGRSARKHFAATSAAALLRIPRERGYVAGGRALQRVWLQATHLGIALQPWSVACYLIARLKEGGGQGFTPAAIEALEPLRDEYQRLFRPSNKDHDLLLFRLYYAPAPSSRSLRRPLNANAELA